MKYQMRNYCILFSLLFLGYSSTYAQDITGEWNGVITQGAGGLSDEYYFSIYINQKGNTVTGFTKVELYEGKKRTFFVRKKVEGTFDGKILLLQETEIIKQEMSSLSNICLIQAKLSFVWDKSSLCLKGTWGGITKEGEECSPGAIKVCSMIPIAKR